MMRMNYQVRFFHAHTLIGIEQFTTFRGAFNWASSLINNNPIGMYQTIVEQI